jgi:hypothetical protein
MSSAHESRRDGVAAPEPEPLATDAPIIAPTPFPGAPTAVSRVSTPDEMLVLQRTAGNVKVGQWLARTKTKQPSFKANAKDLQYMGQKMQEIAQALDYRTRMTLIGDKTLAIGLVVESGSPHLVYTVSNDWINPQLRAAAEKAGLTRWEAGGGRQPRGAQGAPGDAEQIMLAVSEDGFQVAAMVVSRPVCGDCQEAIKAYEQGPIQVAVEKIVASAEDKQITAKLNRLKDYHEVLKNQVTASEGEHKAQLDLINTPSYEGFWGYWTNQLFNKPVPLLVIWDNAHGRLAAAKREMNAGRPGAALTELALARRHYLMALKWYVAWKQGIPGAGAKMQVAIGATAVAVLVAFVAPTIVAGGSSTGAGATAGVAEQQMVVRIVDTIQKADAAMVAAEAAVTEQELLALAEIAEEAAVLGRMIP